jgi:hypothetical protein
MRYFVLGEQGQKYGPADLDTLNSWIAEGRLLPTTMLEDEASGVRSAASAVSGLRFPVVPPPAAVPSGPVYNPAATGGVPYSPPTYKSDEGIGPVLLAFGMFALSLVLTFTIGAFGIYSALVGVGAGWKAKDDRPALGWIATVLCVGAGLFSLYWRTVGHRR